MRIILALCLFCCFAFTQKAAAQVIAADSASKISPSQPASRAERLRIMQAGRPAFIPLNAPFPGEPASYARHDTRRFRLPKTLIPKIRDGEISTISDYFKPTAASTADPKLLADSAYVKDYRYFAYNVESRRMIHPVGTGLIIGGGVLVVVTGVVLVFVAISHIHIHTHIE